MQYELRRTTKQADINVQRGTEMQCILWLNRVIRLNKYKYSLTVDLNMKPVWIMKDRTFYLRKAN